MTLRWWAWLIGGMPPLAYVEDIHIQRWSHVNNLTCIANWTVGPVRDVFAVQSLFKVVQSFRSTADVAVRHFYDSRPTIKHIMDFHSFFLDFLPMLLLLLLLWCEHWSRRAFGVSSASSICRFDGCCEGAQKSDRNHEEFHFIFSPSLSLSLLFFDCI